MPEAPLPPDERERLRALHALGVLDTPQEERFDRITRLATRLLGVPIALVSLVDADRQWFKSCVGLPDRENPRSASFCAHALLGDQTLIVEDARVDPRFADNPYVNGEPFIRFYAGRVLRDPSGHKLGTLCVIDRRPRRLVSDERACLEDLAAIAERELSLAEVDVMFRARVASEERVRAIMGAVADAIVTVGEDGVIDSVNAAAERIFGVSAVEARGRPLTDILHLDAWRGGAERPGRGMRGALAEVVGRPREAVARRPDGTTVPLEVTVTAMDREGLRTYVAVGRDVTERKAAEAALERSRRQHELLLASADEGIIGLDAEGLLVFVNPAASRMLGQDLDAFVGRHLDEALPRSGPDGTPIPFKGSPVAQTLVDGVTRRFERILSRLDGSTFPAEVVAAATRAGGELAGAVVVFRDVTERHELDRMKDEFISVVGHELRTPLTSIRGAIGLLAGGLAPDLTPQGRRLLEIATVNTDRLMRLINDILDLSRIESGRVELQVEPHGARELLEATVPLVSGVAQERGVTVTVDADSSRVAVDGDRMTQVLVNLAANAIKFSPEGGTVELRAAREGELVRFEVRDQGRGIPADRLEVIFERFQQVDATDAREKGGAGLGLAIARSIVDQHGGRIWAESEEGRGSTFIVVLPSLTRTLTEPVRPRVLLLDDEDQEWVRPASDELRARGYEPVRVSTSDEGAWSIDGQAAVGIVSRGGAAVRSLRNLRDRPSSVPVIVVGASGESTDLLAALREELPGIRPRRVLIVEDDADLGEVLVALVERHADVAQVVHSGRQAVEAVDRLEPDLVLLDLQIPDQDGFAVIERLRRAGRLDRTALVVYTALDLDPRDRARLESSGVSVVDKGSTSPEALGAQLARLLDTASGVRTLTAP